MKRSRRPRAVRVHRRLVRLVHEQRVLDALMPQMEIHQALCWRAVEAQSALDAHGHKAARGSLGLPAARERYVRALREIARLARAPRPLSQHL